MLVEIAEVIDVNDVAQMEGFTGGDFSVEDIVKNVNEQRWKALSLKSFNGDKIGIIVYTIKNMTAFIFATTGKNITTKQHWDEVRSFLKNKGAIKIEAAMRDSTLRLWKRLGFRKKYNIAEVYL